MAQLVPCDKNDDRQRWHGANKKSNGKCCSGLRAWNTDQCIQSVSGGLVNTLVCDISGQAADMHWAFTNQGLLQQKHGTSGRRRRCAVLKKDHGRIAYLKERGC